MALPLCAWQWLGGGEASRHLTSREAGTAGLCEVTQHSTEELPISRSCLGPSSPSPGPGAWGGAMSSAQSPKGEGRRGSGVLWASVPAPSEESVGGHRGRSLAPGGNGFCFQSEVHPFSILQF